MTGRVLTVVGSRNPTPSPPAPSESVAALDLEEEYEEILKLARSPLDAPDPAE